MKKLFYFKFMEIVTEGDVPVISSHFGRKCRIAMVIDFQLNEECHKKINKRNFCSEKNVFLIEAMVK